MRMFGTFSRSQGEAIILEILKGYQAFTQVGIILDGICAYFLGSSELVCVLRSVTCMLFMY